LRRGGAALVKAHYALWGRYYAHERAGGRTRFIPLSVQQFCADIGYQKNKDGYRAEQKKQAMQLMESLTSMHMTVNHTTRQGKRMRLKGPIWSRGLVGEEMVGEPHGNESGTGSTGTGTEGTGGAGKGENGALCSGSPNWEAVGFSYGPGHWFDDEDWRKQHRFMGKIAAGLMQLSNHKDQWAILIGGYLGMQGRINGYGPLRLHVSTILCQTGLAQGETFEHRISQPRDKFYLALEKLQNVGVISSFTTVGFDERDVDLDDDAALAEYGTSDPYPPGDWRKQLVEFTFPFEKDRERLQEGKARGIQRAGQRKTHKSEKTKKKTTRSPKGRATKTQAGKGRAATRQSATGELGQP
jgi:hypothetical protein